jgi:hypothetical protein
MLAQAFLLAFSDPDPDTGLCRTRHIAIPGGELLAAEHRHLVHADGSQCPDGCDWAAVPSAMDEYNRGEVPPTVLELAFKYGQNDFQPRHAPSVSVGDVLHFEYAERQHFFEVEAIGFRKLTDEEVRAYGIA